ncbi:hypothetical protein [Streptomyces mirabilis]|uniref:hypothetical protein n=1 Tax=Streptomyces mirabilis TaxID=68239 RepID=UPI0036AC2A59
MEQLFAALVARAIHTLQRDTAEYPARADVFVLPEGLLERPDAAPSGWRHIAAPVVVTARWPWSLDDEDQRVVTDAFRAVGSALDRQWPGMPEEFQPAGIPLDMLAALRGNVTSSGAHALYEELVSAAVFGLGTGELACPGVAYSRPSPDGARAE